MIEVACDVDNPLVGEQGAAMIFGPQKGQRLQWYGIGKRFKSFAELIQQIKGHDFRHLSGGGAAGGISVAAAAFMNAKLKPALISLLMQ